MLWCYLGLDVVVRLVLRGLSGGLGGLYWAWWFHVVCVRSVCVPVGTTLVSVLLLVLV